MGKTIDQFNAVTTPATTDTFLVTQSGVTLRETIAQLVSAIKATDAQAIAATATTAVLTPANISALKATDAQVVSGTSNTSLVTPAGLAAKTATSVATGLVELLTDAEAITGTDTGRALTAANLKAVMQGLAYSVNMAEGTSVTTAGTCNIWTGDGNTRHLVGTTAVTNFATAPQAGSWMRIIADAAHALTHSATLDCPGSTSITCATGDTYEVYAETPTTFKVRNYTRQDGTALVSSSTAISARATRSTAQTIADDTWTKIQFGTETFDTHGFYDNATNYRFLPTTAGYYNVVVSVGIEAGTDLGALSAGIYKNGVVYSQNSGLLSGTGRNLRIISDIVNLNGSTDYVEGWIYQDTAGAQNTSSVENFFSISYIGQ